jgi:hypothetical protein
MQKTAQRIVNDKLDNEAPAYRATQAALVAMTPDGAIRSIVGGKDYEASQFNRHRCAAPARPSFKPFVYLAALKAGFKPTSVVYDSPVSVGNWTPKNPTLKYAGRHADQRAGPFNSVPVHLMLQIGRKAIIDTALNATSNRIYVDRLAAARRQRGDPARHHHRLCHSPIAASLRCRIRCWRPPPSDRRKAAHSRESNAAPLKRVEPVDKIAELNTMMNQVVVMAPASAPSSASRRRPARPAPTRATACLVHRLHRHPSPGVVRQ